MAAWLTNVTDVEVERAAERAEHGPVVHRLRRRDRGVGVAHGCGGDGAAEEHEVGLDAEERRAPQHQIGALADLERAQLVGHALGDRRD